MMFLSNVYSLHSGHAMYAVVGRDGASGVGFVSVTNFSHVLRLRNQGQPPSQTVRDEKFAQNLTQKRVHFRSHMRS